jgi:hypothetical protein
MSRPKHKVKELEALLQQAEAHRWRVDHQKVYFRIRCPCGKHKRWVHLSPSDPNYGKNLRMWLRRQPCWEER